VSFSKSRGVPRRPSRGVDNGVDAWTAKVLETARLAAGETEGGIMHRARVRSTLAKGSAAKTWRIMVVL